ncbi:hypothetical protein Taro_021209 [Colocasia esculenta]|uniref:Uncharacterized protein n=1 Tax=Colocasia esculenta TaxID=4460 RepID=A0A843VAU1_COLES|nr:hypothetical protein [Colocasia esculenta]
MVDTPGENLAATDSRVGARARGEQGVSPGLPSPKARSFFCEGAAHTPKERSLAVRCEWGARGGRDKAGEEPLPRPRARTDCAIVVHGNELHWNILHDYGGKMLNDVSHCEAFMMDCRSEVRRHSFLQQNPKFTDIFSPRASRSSKPREKDKAPQRHVVAQDTDGRPSFPPKFPGNYQKIWPSKVSMGSEELVKHMSNVPVYLQRTERGHNLQEKALNFGVLDWQRLAKWTDNHRWGTEHGYASGSPASSNASSPFTTFGSSSQSCRSSASSYLNQRNQSPSVHCHRDPSTGDDQTHLSEEASRIKNDIACHPPGITPGKCPVRHRITFSLDRCSLMDSLAASYKENKRKGPDSASVSDSLRSSFRTSTLPPRSKNREKMKSHDFRSEFREKSGDLRHVCHSTSPCALQDCPQNHRSGLCRLDRGMLDHLEENFQGNRRISFASPRNSATRIEPGRASLVGTFPSKDHQFSRLSLSVPRSCPLSSDIHGNGWLGMRPSSDLGGRTVPFDSITSSQRSDEDAMVRLNGCHGKHEKYATKLQKDTACETPGRLHRIGIKALTRGRESEPSNQSNTDLIRSSSLRENSDAKQGKWTPLASQNPERETDISKSRRSPLRRLLDPLRKSKAFNLSLAAGLTVGTPRPSSYDRKFPTEENLVSNQGPRSLFHTTPRSSISDSVNGSPPPSCMPAENLGSSYGGKHEVSSRQGLLQVSWKNGLPLFTFSLNESDILAATWKRGTSSKEDYECIYTFYHVCEIKKKIGGWISQGNKGKRKELVTNAIGQMNVTCLKCPRNHFTVREFILFGPKLRPTARETLDPVPNSELAAIVLRVPEGSTESFIDNLPHINNVGHLLKPSLETNRHAYSPGGNWVSGQILEKNYPKMVAILPSEVHGLSDTGKPATLVERWKSGGLCDCGGWDAGCSLKILTNNLLHSMSGSLQSCKTLDGTCRVELFIQGEGQERKPLFRLVTFNEGLYTVDFDASIEVLQAFSVCIAILHGKKPRGPCELQGSRLCKSMDGCVVKNSAGKPVGSSISMPHHPPLSPVGRA